jgi:hypothetical protein
MQDHDDWDCGGLGPVFEKTADLDPVQAGQVDVQNDQRRGILPDQSQAILACSRLDNSKFLL